MDCPECLGNSTLLEGIRTDALALKGRRKSCESLVVDSVGLDNQ